MVNHHVLGCTEGSLVVMMKSICLKYVTNIRE